MLMEIFGYTKQKAIDKALACVKDLYSNDDSNSGASVNKNYDSNSVYFPSFDHLSLVDHFTYS